MIVFIALVFGVVFTTIGSFFIACIGDLVRRKRARDALRERERLDKLEDLKRDAERAKRRDALQVKLTHLQVKRERLLSIYDASTVRQQITLDDTVYKLDCEIQNILEELEGL